MRTKKLTLLELIIAIMVLGLLTALAMPQFIDVKANADVAAFKNDIDVLHKAVDEMYVREDKLPLSNQVNTTEKPLDEKLLDVVYASGDSGKHLYKIDLSQSKKYHHALKTEVTEDDFFFYSKETGKIFYTKGMIDGDNKTLYTMEYIGLSNLKIGSNSLVNNMSVPVVEAIQTIEGSVPVNSDVSVSINGTNVPVTYEDVTFEGTNNILAASKTKKFTSEVLLTQNKNVLTIKTGGTVTNFNIYLGESGEETDSSDDESLVMNEYLIMEVIGSTPATAMFNAVAINELYFYDEAGVKIPVTTITAYDSVEEGIPDYWNDGSFGSTKLTDDNLNTKALFLHRYYNSSKPDLSLVQSDDFARVLFKFTNPDDATRLSRIVVNSHDLINRGPRFISFYTTDSEIDLKTYEFSNSETIVTFDNGTELLTPKYENSYILE